MLTADKPAGPVPPAAGTEPQGPARVRAVPARRKKTADRPPWLEPPRKTTVAARALALTVVVLVVAYPLLGVIGTSFASQTDIVKSTGLVLWPDHPTLEAYRTIFTGGVVLRALLVSIAVTVLGTAASLLVTIGMAYGLSRREVTGSRFMLLTALFTMLFNPGIVPNFLLVNELGLYDTYAALVLPTLVSAFNLVVLRSFFMNLPEELLDAARVDGAGDLRILLRVVLPLSKAVLAVISLFYAVTYWNAFFNALLYLDDAEKWPIPLVLRTFVLQGQSLGGTALGESTAPQQSVQMAVLVVAVVPILLVYPFLQRYFTKGVLTGAVKG
ncbi:carbohydrate ABC transporter permease [Streptomyces albus]|uniref:carbohydrate ABC transporter permease n=1 Tax=Streptomyces albus TaxID=1888 RepID=UPI003F1A45FF